MNHPKQSAPTTGLHTLTFSVQPSAAPEAGKPVRFSGVAYSGGIVPSYGWLGDVAIDLSTLQNAQGDQLPVLVDHDTRIESLAGKGRIRTHTDPAGLASLHIEGELTPSTEAGQRIAALMAEGFPLQMSVGMSANLREVSQPIAVNGQSLTVKGVFEQPLLREVSFVAVGADPNTRAGQTLSIQFPTTRSPEETPAMARTPEDEALITGLQTQVAEMQATIEAQRVARRTADLSALMGEIGRDVPAGDAAKPYMAMADEAFATFSADLRAVHQAHKQAAQGRNLFASQSTAKAMGEAGKGEPQGAGKALMSAVAKLTGKPAATV